ncbi:YslB family protein [Bacillus sp. DTU_2020_1000418_1_SI_GHA_SEK_038]|uniref:YslB family protein n=1 Tax=Bacillus sp. DTU_2020_1000418_1_SI_GHA_SEK_038 TaxID=3077585 RepID=UPI0028E84407|nr:YslB family protein [Bacillus sp. DTU_2020_1000418_1_SI_GHA_SEK_038]WNS74518.1 YslB family protein [Bacillus sp. DTU_2020_1000418_1_SI_GHA_SEK_038]
MNETATELRPIEQKNEFISVFGYELIREVLLHDILGDDTPEILYWAGKSLARKYPQESISHMIDFFKQASWGNLVLKKESKSEMEFELSSSFIQERCKKNSRCTFQLEAGFIAQQIELQSEVICEAYEHPNKRKGKVQFTIKWDKKDKTEF